MRPQVLPYQCKDCEQTIPFPGECTCQFYCEEECPRCHATVCQHCGGTDADHEPARNHAATHLSYLLAIPLLRAAVLDALAVAAEGSAAGSDCVIELITPDGSYWVGVDENGEPVEAKDVKR